MFFKGSRYEKVDEHKLTDSKGRVLRYKKIRYIPETKPQKAHVVVQGERLDHIAYRHYRDPERFWRICDANDAMWPDDLLEADRKLLIPPSKS